MEDFKTDFEAGYPNEVPDVQLQPSDSANIGHRAVRVMLLSAVCASPFQLGPRSNIAVVEIGDIAGSGLVRVSKSIIDIVAGDFVPYNTANDEFDLAHGNLSLFGHLLVIVS